MTATLIHRGPDGDGIWGDPEAGVALAFRRLAIIDLSATGDQPMTSRDGRHVLVFNGEIYNHAHLRAELEAGGRRFVGRSDTEVLLQALSRWGTPATLERLNGMFAFALWDRAERVLTLARDRIGEKPLYYGWLGETFAFASELKALRANGRFSATIDRRAVSSFFQLGYVPTPLSIFDGIRKLPAGSWFSFSVHRGRTDPTPQRFWSVMSAVEAGVAGQIIGSDEEVVECLDDALSDAVAIRMQADVPVGAFLSGGTDSTAIAALMQAVSPRAVKTFTISSAEPAFDEAQAAQRIARHLGTDHTDLRVTPVQAADVIPKLSSIFDEPFGGSAAIPTYLVARLARESVKVSLSGDGGDELFGGYHRHIFGPAIWRATRRAPRPLKVLASRLLTAVSPAQIDRWYRWVEPLIPPTARQAGPGQRLHHLAPGLEATDFDDLHRILSSQWNDSGLLPVSGSKPWLNAADEPGMSAWPRGLSLTERMMYLDQLSYLPDNNLMMVDRASMANGLEVRVPILDYRVIELSWRLPIQAKVRGTQGKWILRRVLDRYVPQDLTSAPKHGFALDVGGWIKGPLRGWAEDLLDERALVADGYTDAAAVRQCWEQHLSGRRDWTRRLWSVLMFQSWMAGTSP